MLSGVEERPGAAIVTLPGAPPRRPRRPLRPGEPRGEILLFTGVRYERAAEPKPAAPQGVGERCHS